MTEQPIIDRAFEIVENLVGPLDRDLRKHPAFAVPMLVGILTEEFTTETGSGEPLAFHAEDAAHVVAELVQAGHDLAGACGRVEEPDAAEFEVIERPAAHLESIHPVVYYVVPVRRHWGETIDAATVRDGLTQSQILGWGCGVGL